MDYTELSLAPDVLCARITCLHPEMLLIINLRGCMCEKNSQHWFVCMFLLVLLDPEDEQVFFFSLKDTVQGEFLSWECAQ